MDALETAARCPCCGALGWVDADRGPVNWPWPSAPSGSTVPLRRDRCFGTGAGITSGSDPGQEWDETELKASRLLAPASRPQRAAEASHLS
ncbi:hypothetical protein ABZ281_14190 [Streptomyces sp. NPDC006265]|uniref:hypothetical protein n=1 Tax=Streptomyces sp. NPDC006265 TaxID=3156740 RepID=UPI0033B7A85F